MGMLNKWLKVSSPMVKVLMAVSITSGLVFFHKLYYVPYVKKKRALRAEAWADMIIEHEDAVEKSTKSQ